MIDIHSHIIPNVDDGSTSMDASINLLKDAIKEGITDIICTPHYRKMMFETSIDEIKEQFNNLVIEAKRNDLDVNLYLGQEIYIRRPSALRDYKNNNRLMTLNNSDWLLLEFSYTNDIDISEVVFNAKLDGYNSIIAHIERYQYVDINQAIEIKSSGALIQVNASSINGKYGFATKRRVMKLIKNNLVDFVASDIHQTRENGMAKAYNKIVKKFGLEVANKLFKENAKILLK